jgi:hypothetical protein
LKSRIVAAALGAGIALIAGVPSASADAFHPDNLPNTFALGTVVAKCLEVADWRTDNGAPARQWGCHYGGNQQWRPGPDGSLVNVNSGKCLEIADWRTDNGAPARQWDCTGGSNQKWYWTHIPGTGYTLRNANSGKCLDIDRQHMAYDGTPALQWDCWNGDNQIWFDLGLH